MTTATLSARHNQGVVQFSVFTANRLGRLYDLTHLLHSHAVHVLALTVVDLTDSAIIRCVVDDPEKARTLMHEHKFPFTESPVVVVEMDTPAELNRAMAALLEAELNINHLYSFIPHPRGKSIAALSMEDNEMGEQVLRQHQFQVLKQIDLAR